MNTTPRQPPSRLDADPRLLIAATIAGARRPLRGQPDDVVDDAVADALVSVLVALERPDFVVHTPEAFAATAGRNRGVDLQRLIAIDTRRRADVGAAEELSADIMIAGLHPAEARQHLADVVAIARTVAAQRGTRELAEVAAALASLADGRPLAIADGATRRRLARGAARLLPLVAA